MNEQLKEKIANILYDGAMQGIHPLTVAQQILDLPMPDLKCTMGYCWGLAISVNEGKLEEFLREKCKDCDFSKFYEKEKK